MADDVRNAIPPLPVPDPTIATNEALERGLKSERDYVDGQLEVVQERLRGIDVATKLLNEGVDRVPHAVTKEVKHLRELTEEKFVSVQTQFTERDTRQEREAKDNQIRVDAAFAAQKESAAEQNKSNTLAISKSETATAETISKLSELVKSQTDALAEKVDDLKDRVRGMEAVKQGGAETRAETRASTSNTTTIIGSAIAVIVVVLSAISFFYMSTTNDTPADPVVVTVPTNP